MDKKNIYEKVANNQATVTQPQEGDQDSWVVVPYTPIVFANHVSANPEQTPPTGAPFAFSALVFVQRNDTSNAGAVQESNPTMKSEAKRMGPGDIQPAIPEGCTPMVMSNGESSQVICLDQQGNVFTWLPWAGKWKKSGMNMEAPPDRVVLPETNETTFTTCGVETERFAVIAVNDEGKTYYMPVDISHLLENAPPNLNLQGEAHTHAIEDGSPPMDITSLNLGEDLLQYVEQQRNIVLYFNEFGTCPVSAGFLGQPGEGLANVGNPYVTAVTIATVQSQGRDHYSNTPVHAARILDNAAISSQHENMALPCGNHPKVCHELGTMAFAPGYILPTSDLGSGPVSLDGETIGQHHSPRGMIRTTHHTETPDVLATYMVQSPLPIYDPTVSQRLENGAVPSAARAVAEGIYNEPAGHGTRFKTHETPVKAELTSGDAPANTLLGLLNTIENSTFFHLGIHMAHIHGLDWIQHAQNIFPNINPIALDFLLNGRYYDDNPDGLVALHRGIATDGPDYIIPELYGMRARDVLELRRELMNQMITQFEQNDGDPSVARAFRRNLEITETLSKLRRGERARPDIRTLKQYFSTTENQLEVPVGEVIRRQVVDIAQAHGYKVYDSAGHYSFTEFVKLPLELRQEIERQIAADYIHHQQQYVLRDGGSQWIQDNVQ